MIYDLYLNRLLFKKSKVYKRDLSFVVYTYERLVLLCAYGGKYMAFGNERGFDEPREMHKIVCSDCGKEAEVPFKPVEDRPVFCKDCYKKRKGF